MKKLSIFLLALVIIAAGCSKKLDVQPTQSIDESEVFTSDANVKAALNGAYDAISNGYFLGGDLQLYSELLGSDGEIRWAGTYSEPREIFNKSILTNNLFVTSTWSAGYKVINICNNILNHIDIVAEADQDWVKGEALFLRGVSYFEMVQLYAKPYSAGNPSADPGMQLITAPTLGNISDDNYVARSTVQQTYDFIINDLTQAKALMLDAQPDERFAYPTNYAASAYLSRVYLQMADYTKARDEADFVISNGSFELNGDYSSAFNNSENTSEDIFAIQVSDKDGDNDMHLFWSTPDDGARDGDVDVEQQHLDLYEADDARLALFYLDEQDIYRSGKWKLNYKNLSIIRLAEMYLTRAEANFRLGEEVGATPDEDINEMIRGRVGLDPIAITLDNITYERHLELAHEGQRIHDIKRLKQSVDGFDFDANELVFPIPVREVNASGGVLVQNAGY